MTSKISPIINPVNLVQLKGTKSLIIVDARVGTNAKKIFVEHHLDGALYVDMDTDLADIKPDVSIGGRHPLPTPEHFSMVLSKLGITPSSHVIVYDDKNGANAAARFWWMMRAAGHENVQLLNGGFDAAVKAGFSVSSNIEISTPSGNYPFSNWLLPIVNMDEVERVRQNEEYLIIDVRDQIRFDGIKEPIDLIAGHIPGAVNVPLTSNLNSEGFYLSPEELKEKYLRLISNRPADKVIVHCGSGVSACHTLLAMNYADLEMPNLYVGSWSEWSRNSKPIGKTS